jgi:hypothetical protein
MLQILTEEEILEKGLILARFTLKQRRGAGQEKNGCRFITHCGLLPLACAQLWEALQVKDKTFNKCL